MSNFSIKALPYYMQELKKSLDKFIADDLKALELSDCCAKYLYALHIMGGMATPSMLTSFTHFDKAHTSRNINELLANELVTKENNRRRNIDIKLTKEGEELAKKIDEDITKWETMLTSHLTHEEHATFEHVLNSIITKARNI